MSLPFQAIDRLFARLSATYGRDFTNRWEGLDENAVKSIWAHELAGFGRHLESLAWALENLPERAPNSIEFRNLARKAPLPEMPKLTHSAAGQERIATELAKMGKQLPAGTCVDARDWARAILEQAKVGAKRSPAILKMARDALAAV